jgi:hypothetical protein
MPTSYPLLKYACTPTYDGDELEVEYRLRHYKIGSVPADDASRMLDLMDGRRSVAEIARESGTSESDVEVLVGELEQVPLVVDGMTVLRQDGHLSGSELFWRMEALLFRWRYKEPLFPGEIRLDEAIASGQAAPSVAKGYCLESSHVLRSAPDEIALAIAHSPNEDVRNHYMKFYIEERTHGGLLVKALTSWGMTRQEIQNSVPLPTTAGLLQAYKGLVQKDVLYYAACLMRDEASSLDADTPPERDMYTGMERHYGVPDPVVKFLRWHEAFDKKAAHGFFPELVFSSFPIIDEARARGTVGALRLIIDLHDSFRRGVLEHYSKHEVGSRWSLLDDLYTVDRAPGAARIPALALVG